MNDFASSKNTTPSHQVYLLGCADLFRLLSLFYLNPTNEVAQGVFDGSIEHDMRTIFEDIGIDEAAVSLQAFEDQRKQSRNASELRDKLRQDYTALFTHPKQPLISIYEMQFRDKRDGKDMPTTLFLNEAALHAEKCYRDAGLALSNEHSREPADHIALELEFMAYLHTQLLCSISNEDSAAQQRWQHALNTFAPHLKSWGIDFFHACVESNCGIVYPCLGTLGTIFLEKYFSEK